jgi:hypothetical protein
VGKFHVRRENGQFTPHPPGDPSTGRVRVTGRPTGADMQRLLDKALEKLKDGKR